MSKRFALNLQQGERKKAKLDFSVSNHDLPLSQNFRENDFPNWGDDNDDEILLQASQACEEAINSETSMLPEYNMWEPPGTTSTQCQPAPSTSKAPFIFKKPNSNSPSAISLHLKNKCNTISSPLPGIANKYIPETNGHSNLTDDLVINAKVGSSASSYNYSQFLRLQEENEKLKAEYDRLQEKCVTKEGEASILRTQLKSCQVAVDSARMEKTRAQENVKMEYTQKLAEAKSQMAELQTQLEFKNLEIISVKERCKKLESGRRLTQVTIPNHDISSSYRNNSTAVPFDTSHHVKRPHMVTNAVQTEDKAPFLKLNKTPRKAVCKIVDLLPQLLEPTEQQHSLLDYNENLQRHSDLSQKKCKVVNTFHRMPSTPGTVEAVKEKVSLSSVIDDLMDLAGNFENPGKKYVKLFNVLHAVLQDVVTELERISQRLNTTFQKEMDERYIEATSSYFAIDTNQLLKGQPLYRDEQAVSARRLLGALAGLGQASTDFLLTHYQAHTGTSLLDTALRICQLIDQCSVGIHYSGLLLSLSLLLESISPVSSTEGVCPCVRVMVRARAAPGVVRSLLGLTRRLCVERKPVLCRGGNLKLDYDQGLQLYTADSCHMQVLLKQTEVYMKSVSELRLEDEAVVTMDHLTALCGLLPTGTKCECENMLVQVLIYSLRICSVMLESKLNEDTVGSDIVGRSTSALVAACACGAGALQPRWSAGRGALQPRWSAGRGAPHHGLLAHAAHTLRGLALPDAYDNMLAELTSPWSAEDAPVSFHRQPWLLSFQTFSITD